MHATKDFSSTIICDGVPLEEFQTKVQSTSPGHYKATSWIGSTVDKEFQIGLEYKNHTYCDLRVRVHCDGQLVNRCFLSKKREEFTLEQARIEKDGKFELRPLIFGEVEQVEDPQLVTTSDFGTISVRIWRTKKTTPATNSSNAYNPTSQIYEKHKKLGVHCVRVGKLIKTIEVTSFKIQDLDPIPIAEFKFYYRPKAFLQAEGIILMQPDGDHIQRRWNADEADIEGDGTDEDSDEEEVLNARIFALSKRVEKIRSRKKIKREASPIIMTATENAVIDLTSD